MDYDTILNTQFEISAIIHTYANSTNSYVK